MCEARRPHGEKVIKPKNNSGGLARTRRRERFGSNYTTPLSLAGALA